MKNRLVISAGLMIQLFLISACNRFDQTQTEAAIQQYVNEMFYAPDSYQAVRYYSPRKMTVSTDPNDRNNASFSKDESKMIEGWGIAVDIKARTGSGEVSGQSAAFYLNAKCDSVIFSDVAPQFLKNDSLSMIRNAK